jgi:hypothetical protein
MMNYLPPPPGHAHRIYTYMERWRGIIFEMSERGMPIRTITERLERTLWEAWQAGRMTDQHAWFGWRTLLKSSNRFDTPMAERLIERFGRCRCGAPAEPEDSYHPSRVDPYYGGWSCGDPCAWDGAEETIRYVLSARPELLPHLDRAFTYLKQCEAAAWLLSDPHKLVVWRDRVAERVGREDFDHILQNAGSSGTWVVRPETQYGPAEWEFVLDGPALQPEQMVIVPDGPLEAALSDASNTLRFQFREEGEGMWGVGG